MPQFRADFIVRADLVLPLKSPRQELGSSQDFAIFINNAPADSQGHIPHLIAEVIGTSPNFECVKDNFQEALAHRLDALALVTRCRFRISHCIRVLEWESFKSERKVWIIHQQDAYHPPAPNLVTNFATTAGSSCKKIAEKPFLARPVQCFRYGLLAEQPEEQFQYFWSALENLAEVTKTREQVNVTCPQCNSDVYCGQCDAKPLRRKVAAEEMKAILCQLSRDGEAIFKVLQKVRNHLSHGRSPNTVPNEAKIPLATAG